MFQLLEKYLGKILILVKSVSWIFPWDLSFYVKYKKLRKLFKYISSFSLIGNMLTIKLANNISCVDSVKMTRDTV